MTYSLFYSKTAARDIKKLDGASRKMLEKGLLRIGSDPFLGKPLLKELKGYHSYRVPAYRIIYKIEKFKLVILVVAVGHRKNIYDRIKRALLK